MDIECSARRAALDERGTIRLWRQSQLCYLRCESQKTIEETMKISGRKIGVLTSAFCFSAALSSCKSGETPKTGAPQNGSSRVETTWTPTNEDRELGDAMNNFGFGVLKKLDEKKTPSENVVFSPLSIATALTLVEQGAAGKTRSEMQKLLQPAHFSNAQTLSSSAALTQGWQTADARVQVDIANSLWLQRNFTPKPAFTQMAKTAFDAQVRVLDFASPQAAPTINSWIGGKTHGKIKDMVSPQDIQNASLLVANAVYFHGKWSAAFDPKYTRDADFHLASGKTMRVPMMSFPEVKKGSYAKSSDAAFLALPYGNKQLSMIFVLPDKKVALSKIVAQCESGQWNSWMIAMKPQEGFIEIPRFVLKGGFSVGEILQQLGMKSAFSAGADFSAIAPGLFISDVKHKAWMQVDESGTEAAASTTIPMTKGSYKAPPNQFQFIADRPFLAAIRDNRSGNLLFLAEVNQPSQAK